MPIEMELVAMESLQRAADCLKIMAHPIRLRMAEILIEGEFQVSKIAELCDLPSHQASEHLRLMQAHGLLSSQRRGQSVYYKVASPNLFGLIKCIRKNCDGRESFSV